MNPMERRRADVLLERLDAYARERNCYENGLPMYDEGQKALMREIVEDWLREFPSSAPDERTDD